MTEVIQEKSEYDFTNTLVPFVRSMICDEFLKNHQESVTLKCSEIIMQLRIYISEERRERIDEELEGDVFLTFDFLSDDILCTQACEEGMLCFPSIRIDGDFVHFTLSPQMQAYFSSIAESTDSKRDIRMFESLNPLIFTPLTKYPVLDNRSL